MVSFYKNVAFVFYFQLLKCKHAHIHVHLQEASLQTPDFSSV